MTSSKLVLSLSLAFALAACSTESRKKPDFGGEQRKAYDFDEADGTTFRVRSISPIAVQTTAWNSYGHPSARLYSMKACLQDKGLAAVPGGVLFRVGDGAGGARTLPTDVEGCIYWSENIQFDYLAADETYYTFTRTISATNRYRGDVYAKLAFNPWSEAAGGAMIDTRFQATSEAPVNGGLLTMSGARVLSNSQPNLKLSLDSVSFEFAGLNQRAYEVSRNLGLTVAHDYVVRLKPTVIRKTLTRTAVPEAFVGGQMKVYLAIFREKKDDEAAQFSPANLISATEFVASYSTEVGMFQGHVTVKFNDVAAMTSRTVALITVVPQEDIPGLPEMNYRALLKPGRLSSISNVASRTFSARRVMAAAAELRARTANAKPVDLLRNDKDLKEIDAIPVPGTLVGDWWSGAADVNVPAELEKHFAAGPNARLAANVERAICYKIYAGDEAKRCALQPSFYLQMGRRMLVEDVLSAPVQTRPTPPPTTMTMSVSLSKSDAVNDTTRINAGVGIDPFKIPILGALVEGVIKTIVDAIPFLKISIGADYSSAREWRTSDSESVTVSSTSAVTTEENEFRFNVNAVSCLLVKERVRPILHTGRPAANSERARPGAWYCSSNPVRRTVNETYYLVGQNIGVAGSMFSDSEANTSGAWRMMVRGKKMNGLLRELLQKDDAKLFLEPMPDTDKPNDLYQVQEAPGVLNI